MKGAIDRLLGGAESSPRRYVEVALLMQKDLQSMQPDSLGDIARRMEDIEGRLGRFWPAQKFAW